MTLLDLRKDTGEAQSNPQIGSKKKPIFIFISTSNFTKAERNNKSPDFYLFITHSKKTNIDDIVEFISYYCFKKRMYVLAQPYRLF